MRRSVEFRPGLSNPFDRCGDARWFFGGEERQVNDDGNVVIFLDDLEKCTATDLQTALRRANTFCEAEYGAVPVTVSENNFYAEDILLSGSIRFELLADHLTFSLALGFYTGDKRELQPLIRSVLDPLLRRHRMTIVQFDLQEALTPPGSFVLHTSIGLNTRE